MNQLELFASIGILMSSAKTWGNVASSGFVCVQDLHHPAMRDRHWKMLMQTTGKQFTMDEKFCLGDLLALELHNFVDACSEIVDRAQKELNIEKQIKKIEDTWAALALMFNPYMDTDIMALQVWCSHPLQQGPYMFGLGPPKELLFLCLPCLR